MTISRRRFLQLSSLFAAPAIIDIDRLMKVAPPPGYIHFDSGELLAPSGRAIITPSKFTRAALEEFRRNIIDPAAEQLARNLDVAIIDHIFVNKPCPFEDGDVVTIEGIHGQFKIALHT